MRLFIFGDVTLDTICRVDDLPAEGDCRVVSDASTFFGGRGANIAIALGKLGMKVALCAIAGGDFHSSGYAAHLIKHKVNFESLKIIEEDKMSGFLLYENPKGGSYAFYLPRVDKHYDALDFDIEALGGYSLIHFTLMHEKFASGVLRKLRNRNKTISASLGKEIRMVSKDYLKLLLSTSNYLFMNEDEAGVLMASTKAAGEKELFKNENLLAIAVTSGDAGSVIHTHSGKIKIPSVRAVKVSNPLGAGDAYAAGFLYGISRKFNLQTCGRIASTVASCAVEGYGAQSSLPSLNKVKRRYIRAFGSQGLAQQFPQNGKALRK